MIDFQISPLPYEHFSSLFNASSSDLEKIGAVKSIVDKKPGFPCRVSLQDAEVGEQVILLPYQHHSTNSPYQATGPIYVRKNVSTASLEKNEIPMMLIERLLSLRAYSMQGFMIEANVVEGVQLHYALQSAFKNEAVEYIHIHNAKPGCFNCSVARVR